MKITVSVDYITIIKQYPWIQEITDKIVYSEKMRERVRNEISEPLKRYAEDTYCLYLKKEMVMITCIQNIRKKCTKILLFRAIETGKLRFEKSDVELTMEDIEVIFNQVKEEVLSKVKKDLDQKFWP